MRIGRIAVAVATAGLVWSAHEARSRNVSSAEERVFRVFNDRPDVLAPLVWPVMQMGSLAAVYAAAAGQYRRSGTEDAAVVALVGTAVWGGIKLIKPSIGRGRPGAHLDGVHVRGQAQTGLGYPSGHAAVSLTLALGVSSSRRTRPLALAAAACTAVSRMYVGAHLPLDVVGGGAVGWLVGSGWAAARRTPCRNRRTN